MKSLRILGLILALSVGAQGIVASEAPVKHGLMRTLSTGSQRLWNNFTGYFTAEKRAQVMDRGARMLGSAWSGLISFKNVLAEKFVDLKESTSEFFKENPKTAWGIILGCYVATMGTTFGVKAYVKAYRAKLKREREEEAEQRKQQEALELKRQQEALELKRQQEEERALNSAYYANMQGINTSCEAKGNSPTNKVSFEAVLGKAAAAFRKSNSARLDREDDENRKKSLQEFNTKTTERRQKRRKRQEMVIIKQHN